MKKQIAIIGMLSALLFSAACSGPKKDQCGEEPKAKEKMNERESGCGCSSENILDLRGTTEESGDRLSNPTARL